MVSDDENVLRSERIARDENASHHRSEGVCHHGAGDLDDLRVAVLEVQRGGQQLRESRVHAGDDDELLVWEAIGQIRLVRIRRDEPVVVLQHRCQTPRRVKEFGAITVVQAKLRRRHDANC